MKQVSFVVTNAFLNNIDPNFRGMIIINQTYSERYKYRYDNTNNTFYFQLGTPSNKSFFIFGCLYDPEDGIFYATSYKNRNSAMLFDAVLLFEFILNEDGITKEVLTKAFTFYKLSGNLEDLVRVIREDLIKKEDKSIIYRHLVNSVSYEYLSADHKGLSMSEIGDNISEFLLYRVSQTLMIFNELGNPARKYRVSDITLNEKRSLKTDTENTVSVLNKHNFNFSSADLYLCSCKEMFLEYSNDFNEPDDIKKDYLYDGVLEFSIDEFLDSQEEVIYSNNLIDTLSNNGFKDYMSDKIRNKVNRLDSDQYNNIAKNYIKRRFEIVKCYDDNGLYQNVLGIKVSDIIIINRSMRKI